MAFLYAQEVRGRTLKKRTIKSRPHPQEEHGVCRRRGAHVIGRPCILPLHIVRRTGDALRQRKPRRHIIISRYIRIKGDMHNADNSLL